MDPFSLNLLIAAAAIALTHTVLGPDHTLPFVMLAQARQWTPRRTLVVTLMCGVAHVMSSVVLGVVGLGLGYGVAHITALETARGDLAAWAMVAFGFAYGLWGVRHAVRRRAGIVPHEHQGHLHLHPHGERAHAHAHINRSRTTFWALFTVFVLGPCEPLIPLFVLPASRGRWTVAALTAAVFSVITIATMLGLVGLALTGVQRIPLARLERWSHALAGGVIAGSGLAVIFLGL